jgi:hypothetical protein
MFTALKPLKPEPTPETAQVQPARGRDNPAVAQCEAEWQRVYLAVLKMKKPGREAMNEADFGYREAMPAPVGYSNICAFIACVVYGMLMGRFDPKEGPRLLYGAQVALSTIAPKSKTNGREPSS